MSSKVKRNVNFVPSFEKVLFFFIKAYVFLVFNICFSPNKNCHFFSFVYTLVTGIEFLSFFFLLRIDWKGTL